MNHLSIYTSGIWSFLRIPLLLLVLFTCACDAKNSSTTTTSTDPQKLLIEKGQAAYMANCIACHNPNPKLPGSVGPEIFGSSAELLKTKILEGKYPTDYKPKRETQMMTVLKNLEADILAIHAFLSQ